MKEKIISIVVVVLVIGAIVAFAVLGVGKPSEEANVATVNGVEISKSAYDSQLALVVASYQSQGVDVNNAEIKGQIEAQVLEDMINNELVNQAIAEAGISPTDAQIEEQVQILITQSGGQEGFNSQLTASNLTEAQLRENIKRQLAIQTFLAANIDINSATTTDAEIQEFYDLNVKGQENAPALSEISDQIRQQIVANKQQVLVNAFIDSLRGKATIEKSLN